MVMRLPSDDVLSEKDEALALLYALFEKEQRRPDEARFTVCRRLAERLQDWTPTHIYNVLFKGEAFGPDFVRAVKKAQRPPQER